MDDLPRIRIALVDDHPVVREGLRAVVTAAPDLEVVAEAGSLQEALARLAEVRADVVLLDVVLEADDAFDALPWLRRAAPASRFLVVTGGRDPDTETLAIHAGADGLVRKTAAADFLVKAIRKVHAGELWFEHRAIATALHGALEAVRLGDPATARIAALTPREREVVGLVGEGLRNDEIARRLSLAEKTVRNHVADVCAKLRVHGRLELLVFANQHGLGRIRGGTPVPR